MEEFPKQPNKKFLNPEFQIQSDNNKENIEEIEAEIEKTFTLLKDEISLLEMDIAYLDHMESNNRDTEFIVKKYNSDEITEVNYRIRKTKEFITFLKNAISGYTLLKSGYQQINDDIEDLEKRFKNVLLKIPPQKLQ